MMKKKLLFLGAVLIVLLLISIVLSALLSPKKQEKKQNIPYSTQPSLIPTYPLTIPEVIRNSLPYKTKDFTIDYSIQQDKYVVTRKTPLADVKINQWLTENNLEDKINSKNIILINDFAEGTRLPTLPSSTTPTQTPGELLVEFINIFFGSYDNINSSSTNLSISPSTTPFLSQTVSPTKKPKKPKKENTPVSGFVYYPQCDGDYDDYPLPGGCTICYAGCGSTTAAMILASYIDRKYDPENVADIYGQRGYRLDCGGSNYLQAKALFESLGLKTSDFIIYSSGNIIDEVAKDIRNYIKAGWTVFTLANSVYGGHYFWIVDIDSNNNVLAYDPWYGRLTAPPLNENQYYPYPKYRVAFGVKK